MKHPTVSTCSHILIATQYCDGLRGAFILYDPDDPHQGLYDVDDGMLRYQYPRDVAEFLSSRDNHYHASRLVCSPFTSFTAECLKHLIIGSMFLPVE